MSSTLPLELELSSSCLSCSSKRANIPVPASTISVSLSRLIKGGCSGPRSARGSASGSVDTSGVLCGTGAAVSASGCRCTRHRPCKRLLSQLFTVRAMLLMFFAPSALEMARHILFLSSLICWRWSSSPSRSYVRNRPHGRAFPSETTHIRLCIKTLLQS